MTIDIHNDALTDVLQTLRLKASTYFCSDFAPPWGMIDQQSDQGMFHAVIEGHCWIQFEQQASSIHLEKGDVIAFPTGSAHWITDHAVHEPDGAAKEQDNIRRPGADVADSIQTGNNPFAPGIDQQNLVTLMCGSFSFDTSINHPFLKDLPCYIHLKTSDDPGLTWLNTVLGELATESRHPSPGSGVMIDRLTEVLFIALMRGYMASAPKDMRYLTALMDPKIGQALNLIHKGAETPPTVKSLGEHVALSRTAFNQRFTRLVGMPPKTYLVNWRLQKAKLRLETATEPMIEVAEDAGYSSEAAFGKAFKKFFGVSPGSVR